MNKEWHTAVSDQCNADGKLDFRGFYGLYKGTVLIDGHAYPFEFKHSSKNPAPVVIKL